MGDAYSLPEGFDNSGPCIFCAERVGGEGGRRGSYWMGHGMHFFCEQCVGEGRLGDLMFDAVRSRYQRGAPDARALEEALAATTARMFKVAYVAASAQCERAMHAGFQEEQ